MTNKDNHQIESAGNGIQQNQTSKRRGRPRKSDISRSEQVRLANTKVRDNQRICKQKLLELLFTLLGQSKGSIFSKDRANMLNVPNEKIAKAIMLAAGLDVSETNNDIVNIIRKVKYQNCNLKASIEKALRESKV